MSLAKETYQIQPLLGPNRNQTFQLIQVGGLLFKIYQKLQAR